MESTSNGDACGEEASCSAAERSEEWEALCMDFACRRVARECWIGTVRWLGAAGAFGCSCVCGVPS